MRTKPKPTERFHIGSRIKITAESLRGAGIGTEKEEKDHNLEGKRRREGESARLRSASGAIGASGSKSSVWRREREAMRCHLAGKIGSERTAEI
ncbi:hypothetical protein BHE74_00008371 [Ensete ventricosum]|uniref:Uncharacterized protein n=1 Tax=Ensete ventricosum TaxID=4639 RepID=A0A444G4I6_ENSVE|nr:hypothetical protein GW17_00005665 [Ensete ventricosum]RWW83115.1 hypothetical protein BHE74_00008371 [Ensete ventricosum]RZR75376.1 hypothetical protein BHM03_00056028 [Ensete ventricosum]